MTRALGELKLLNVLDPCWKGQLRGSDVDPGLHFVMKLEALEPGPSSLPGIAACCRADVLTVVLFSTASADRSLTKLDSC